MSTTPSQPSHLTHAQFASLERLARVTFPNRGIVMVRNPFLPLPGYGDDLDIVITNDGIIDGDLQIRDDGRVLVTWDEWGVLVEQLSTDDSGFIDDGITDYDEYQTFVLAD